MSWKAYSTTGPLAGLAQQQADRRLVPLGPQDAVYGREIEVELAGILRLELARLELDNEVAVQAHMVEEQVEVESLGADRKRNLAAEEGGAAARAQATSRAYA